LTALLLKRPGIVNALQLSSKSAIVLEQERRKGRMLPVEDIRAKLLAQRRDLFRQAAQTEEDLLWLETDVEREAMERGQTETMIRLLDRLDEREKLEIEAIDLALTRIETGSYGRCEGCGKSIPVARLEALPTATTCLACGKARETLKR
jgi:DnaK suppressor protein